MWVVDKPFKGAIILSFLLILVMGTRVKAAEEIPENSLWQISRNTEVKEQAAESSREVGSLEKGTPVIVLESAGNNWFKIQYQEISGYVQTDALESYGMERSEDLAQEFMRVQEENILLEDEYTLAQGQEESAYIWKAMIIVFVAAVFGIGIFSALKRNREDDFN